VTLGEIYDFTLSSTLNEFTPFNCFVLDFFFFVGNNFILDHLCQAHN
jgi:hypothetical protein